MTTRKLYLNATFVDDFLVQVKKVRTENPAELQENYSLFKSFHADFL